MNLKKLSRLFFINIDIIYILHFLFQYLNVIKIIIILKKYKRLFIKNLSIILLNNYVLYIYIFIT